MEYIQSWLWIKRRGVSRYRCLFCQHKRRGRIWNAVFLFFWVPNGPERKCGVWFFGFYVMDWLFKNFVVIGKLSRINFCMICVWNFSWRLKRRRHNAIVDFFRWVSTLFSDSLIIRVNLLDKMSVDMIVTLQFPIGRKFSNINIAVSINQSWSFPFISTTSFDRKFTYTLRLVSSYKQLREGKTLKMERFHLVGACNYWRRREWFYLRYFWNSWN